MGVYGIANSPGKEVVIGTAVIPAGTSKSYSWETACNFTEYLSDKDQVIEVHALVTDNYGFMVVQNAHVHYLTNKIHDHYRNSISMPIACGGGSASSIHDDWFEFGERVSTESKGAIYSFGVEQFLNELVDFRPTWEYELISVCGEKDCTEGEIEYYGTPMVSLVREINNGEEI